MSELIVKVSRLLGENETGHHYICVGDNNIKRAQKSHSHIGFPPLFSVGKCTSPFPSSPQVMRPCRSEEISRSCSSIGGGGALAPAPRHLLPRRHDRHHSVLNRPCRNALLYLAREHPRSLPWQANVPSAISRGHLRSMLSVRCRALSHIAC